MSSPIWPRSTACARRSRRPRPTWAASTVGAPVRVRTAAYPDLEIDRHGRRHQPGARPRLPQRARGGPRGQRGRPSAAGHVRRDHRGPRRSAGGPDRPGRGRLLPGTAGLRLHRRRRLGRGHGAGRPGHAERRRGRGHRRPRRRPDGGPRRPPEALPGRAGHAGRRRRTGRAGPGTPPRPTPPGETRREAERDLHQAARAGHGHEPGDRPAGRDLLRPPRRARVPRRGPARSSRSPPSTAAPARAWSRPRSPTSSRSSSPPSRTSRP